MRGSGGRRPYGWSLGSGLGSGGPPVGSDGRDGRDRCRCRGRGRVRSAGGSDGRAARQPGVRPGPGRPGQAGGPIGGRTRQSGVSYGSGRLGRAGGPIGGRPGNPGAALDPAGSGRCGFSTRTVPAAVSATGESASGQSVARVSPGRGRVAGTVGAGRRRTSRVKPRWAADSAGSRPQRCRHPPVHRSRRFRRSGAGDGCRRLGHPQVRERKPGHAAPGAAPRAVRPLWPDAGCRGTPG